MYTYLLHWQGAKGSRTFRLDRVCDDAYIYYDERQRRHESASGDVSSSDAMSGDTEQVSSSTTAPAAENPQPCNVPNEDSLSASDGN